MATLVWRCGNPQKCLTPKAGSTKTWLVNNPAHTLVASNATSILLIFGIKF